MLSLKSEEHIPYFSPTLLLLAWRCSLLHIQIWGWKQFLCRGYKKANLAWSTGPDTTAEKSFTQFADTSSTAIMLLNGGLLRLGQLICTREQNLLHEGLNCSYKSWTKELSYKGTQRKITPAHLSFTTSLPWQ